jgi:polyisoprenoid-binding protein YceI
MSTMTSNLATWAVDPVHSSVEFSIDYMGLTVYRTGFRAISGTLRFDPDRPESGSIEVTIPVASVDVTNERLMSRLLEDDLLGGTSHPNITFRSTKVEAAGGGALRVHGDLTIHGITRPVRLDTRYLGQKKSPFSGKMLATFRAEATLDRAEFGVTWNAPLEGGGTYLGDKVTASLLLVAARQD